METKFKTLLEYLRLSEAKADDEYAKSFSSIDREIFDKICLMDPKTQRSGDTVINIGFGAKQLLLPKYLSGETDFIDNGDAVASSLEAYYPNIKNYPKFPQFESVAAFLTFMENPTEVAPSAAPAEVDKITQIYNQYYSDIPREDFDKIIALDPGTTETKIGDVAKNLLLRCYKRGDTAFLRNPDAVTVAIERFLRDKNSYEREKQNLMNYTTIASFIEYLPPSPIVAALSGTEYEPILGTDYLHLASTQNYDIYKPLTFRGSERIAHARGGQNVWCTAGGSDGTHYGASRDHRSESSYWRDYRQSRRQDIYMFMHKTAPTDLLKNFNMGYGDGKVKEFRNGNNSSTYGGNYEQNGIYLEWDGFLNANPDVAFALASCPDPNLANDRVVQDKIVSFRYASKPLVIASNDDLLKAKRHLNNLKGVLKEMEIRGIKRIPDFFASGFTALTSLTIGEGVEEIGAQAFKGCGNLAKINQDLPETLKLIDTEAFMGCLSLKGSIHIPESLTDVKLRAFDGARCKLKIDINRTTPIRFASADKIWVNGHVQSMKK